MKARQIDKVIYEKVAALAEAHPPIKQVLLKNSIVTGGCIASMLLKEKVNDYDIYFDSLPALVAVMQYFGGKTGAQYLVAFEAGTTLPQEGLIRFIASRSANTSKAIEEVTGIVPEEDDYDASSEEIPLPPSNSDTWYALYGDINMLRNYPNVKYISLFYKSRGFWSASDEDKKKNEIDGLTHTVKFASANAVTLSEKVQLVFRFFGPAAEIHKNYDFVHATNYWTYNKGLVTNTEALEAILARELIYKGSRFPLASIFRTRKFIQRGWTIHIANYVKMAFQLNEMNLCDLHVLREQLTGVDAAYLNHLIMQCERAHEPITSSYVCDLVDKLLKGAQEEEPEDGHDDD